MGDEEQYHMTSRLEIPMRLAGLNAEECVFVGIGAVRQFLLSIYDQLEGQGIDIIPARAIYEIALSLDGEFVHQKKPKSSEGDNQ